MTNRAMGVLRHAAGLGVLLAFWGAGEAVSRGARLPLPGSVVGMLLLAGALRLGWVPLGWVRPPAELLLRHMGLLFVPAGVGLMAYGGVLRREWLPITAGAVAGTLAVLAVVGVLQQRMGRDG